MTTAAPAVVAFIAGEISPLLRGRTDLDRYYQGADESLNMVPLPHGPVRRRSGTYYVAGAKSNSAASVLLPFSFNESQSYVLELANNVVRFYSHSGAAWSVDNVATAIANGTFASNLTSWTDADTGGTAASVHSAVGGGRMMLTGDGTEYAVRYQTVTVALADQAVEHVLYFEVPLASPSVTGAVPGDTIDVRVGTTISGTELVNDTVGPGFHTVSFTPGTGTVYVEFRSNKAKALYVDNVRLLDNETLEIGSPYPTAVLADVRIEQSADVLYLFCAEGGNNSLGHRVWKLERFSDLDWSLSAADIDDGPYLDQNTTAVTLDPTATAAGTLADVLTASAATFASTDVGRLVALKHSSTWGWGVIVAYTSPTQVSVDIRSAYGAATAVTTWKLGAWSDTTGFPAVGEIHEQRLVAGGAAFRPDRYDASEVGDYESFAPGTATDSDAFAAAIPTGGVNPIRWLSSSPNALLIGTEGAELRLGNPNSSSDEPLSPTNLPNKQQDSRGSEAIDAVKAAGRAVFVQRRGKKVRSMGYDWEASAFIVDDLTELAEHITSSGVVALAYQDEPWSVLWGVRADGVLLSCTYKPDQRMAAWSRHILGGVFGASGDPVVETICVITAPTGDDQLWMVVKRTINGSTVRFIEVLQDFDNDDLDQEDCFYVDAGLTYDGSPVSSVSGLSHLEGQTVQVLGDGAAQPEQVVTSGAITLETAASVVHVGLGFTPRLKTTRLEAGAMQGSAQGKIKRIDTVDVRLNRSLGVRIGPDDDHLEDIEFRTPDMAMDEAVPLFTGDKEHDLTGDWEKEGQILLTSEQPLPMCIVGLYPHVVVTEL